MIFISFQLLIQKDVKRIAVKKHWKLAFFYWDLCDFTLGFLPFKVRQYIPKLN